MCNFEYLHSVIHKNILKHYTNKTYKMEQHKNQGKAKLKKQVNLLEAIKIV